MWDHGRKIKRLSCYISYCYVNFLVWLCGYVFIMEGLNSWLPWFCGEKLILDYTPCFNEVEKGVYWFHLVRLSVCKMSVCGQNHVRSVSSTILVRSISYLHILSSNFTRCVACNGCFKSWNFGEFFKFVTLTLSSFDFGSNQYDPMVWVIMRPRGVGVGVGGILRAQAF